jgi:hypothetical protein
VVRAAPQPTEPTKNIYYEIPLGIMEKLLANPYAGDGTIHRDMHLIYIDEICGFEDGVKMKVFPLSLVGNALSWYRLLDESRTWDWK